MAEIKVLSDNVANQIAAGEVVERPMSVLKELLENSLDAGASRITIEFRDGGRSFMSIEDNGSGMSQDSALLALERHATSKIRLASDLDHIATFGFRGEALPSIASVSKFVIKTRTEGQECGTEISIHGGKSMYCKDIGMPYGTKIEVSHLFFNVPARLKFLKSENTEAAHITRMVRLYSVAHPEVSFILRENGREIFHSPAGKDVLTRVGAIWGKQLEMDLIPIGTRTAFGMTLTGLIGKPGVSRASRQEMVMIVNGRPVDNRTMAYSLVESYHTIIPRGRYPLGFLFLEIDPMAVDVNVHPAKREIRFRDESRVRNLIITAVLDVLNQETANVFNSPEDISSTCKNPTPASPFSTSFSSSSIVAKPIGGDFSKKEIIEKSLTSVSNEISQKILKNSISASSKTNLEVASNSQIEKSEMRKSSFSGNSFHLENWHFLGKFSNEPWSIFQLNSALVVFNIRYAMERIWYERILERFKKETPVSQQLLLPEPIEFEPIQADVLIRHLNILQNAGFEVEEFGRNFFRILSIPDWISMSADVKQILRDLVERISRLPADFSRANFAHDMLAKMAGQQSYYASQYNTDSQIKIILEDLFKCSQPNINPDGKKIFIEISSSEINRRFL